MSVALVKSDWNSGNLRFQQKVATGNASVSFGIDDVGVDVNFYGATSTKRSIWDQSADMWVMSGTPVQFKGAMTTTAPFDFDSTNSYFADFASAGVAGLSLTADGMSQDPETASEDGWLELLVGASKYQMPVYLNT